MKPQPDTFYYYGNDCTNRYWVYNEEHGCIAYGRIASEYDELAEELKKQAKERKVKATG